MRVWKISLIAALVLILIFPLALGAVGYVVFTHAHEDRIEHADAIVVLGGEHDGRIEYALRLANSGVANTVLLSNPYSGKGEQPMKQYCDGVAPGVTIICFRPNPSTTLGEAKFTAELARVHDWKRVIVVSWRYHLPRARFIFGQCFHGQTIMRAVPREYRYSWIRWEFTYLYQVGGFAKAVVAGC